MMYGNNHCIHSPFTNSKAVKHERYSEPEKLHLTEPKQKVTKALSKADLTRRIQHEHETTVAVTLFTLPTMDPDEYVWRQIHDT